MDSNIQADIDAINKISIVPTLLEVVSKTTKMRFVAIARVTDTKWVTCKSLDEINFGLKPGDELELETTICNEIRQHHSPVIIDEVATDENFCTHHTPLKYGFQSYISYPIFRRDGTFFGTLCAIDPAPAKLDVPEIRGLFKLYAELISFHLEAIDELAAASARLKNEQKIAELRETFIAVLGHDLRNPVGTTRMCADIILKAKEMPESVKKHANIIKSTSYRMQGLIDNILDFAKGHLGEGIRLDLENDNAVLQKALQQVVTEIGALDSNHKVHYTEDLREAVNCDPNRMAQLLSNLLGNAIKHGAENQPIHINASTSKDNFELSVTNFGEVIPPEVKQELFKPYFKKDTERNKTGLGLGLYISSEIAKAHGGRMEVTSTDENTCFTFRMPLQ